VIRQAISCDICGAEKKQSNHWFVAYGQGEELRLSGWSSRHAKRPGTMHLCGHKCLHRLVDDFMARALAVRTQPFEGEAAGAPVAASDTSLTSSAARPQSESAARPPAALMARTAFHTEVVALPEPFAAQDFMPPLDEPPRYASRNWRAEAWERERERELRAAERRPDIMARRSS